MRRAIRLFMLGEGATFIAAALVHFGVLTRGYEHAPAGTAETVIGIVLLIGLAANWILPKSTRGIGLAVQTFALFGTLVGIFTIAAGIGPRTVPDIAYHAIISIALLCGLIVAFRARAREPRPGREQTSTGPHPYQAESRPPRFQPLLRAMVDDHQADRVQIARVRRHHLRFLPADDPLGTLQSDNRGKLEVSGQLAGAGRTLAERFLRAE